MILSPPIPTQLDGSPDYPAWVELVRFNSVRKGKTDDEKQIFYTWDAFVQKCLKKLWQFALDHPRNPFPVAYNPETNSWVWLTRRQRRKLLRTAAKAARLRSVRSSKEEK